MSVNGLLTEVRWEWDGTELSADALLGDTLLPVLEPTAISIDELVWIDFTGPYTVTDVDEENDTITIEPGLTEDCEEGIEVVPDIGGQPAQVWVAEVVLPDADSPIEVPLTIKDLSVMPEQVYDPPVAIVITPDLRSVVDLPGSIPVVDGNYIPPDSIPLPETSDGFSPEYSPQPTVIEGIGAFFLRWVPPENPDPLRFEVHVSDTEGFEPTEDTLYTETGSYSATVRNLPWIVEETGQFAKFLYSYLDVNTGEDIVNPYYFRIIAKDADGPASPGPQAEGVLHQIEGSDVRANTITAENIVVGTLTGDLFSSEVTLGSKISTGALDENGDIVGARVELGPDGLRVVDSNETDVFYVPLDALNSAKMRAHFEMLSATVIDNFSLYGVHNEIKVGSSLFIANGVTAPTATPSVSYTYPSRVLFDKTTVVGPNDPSWGNLGSFRFDPSQVTSITWDAQWGVWVVIQQRGGGFRIWRFETDGSIVNNSGSGRPWVDDYEDKYDATVTHGSGSGATLGLCLLMRQGSDWYVWAPNAINRIPSSWIVDTGARPPCVGYDTVNDRYMIAQNNGGGSGTLHVRRFATNNYSGSGAFPNATSSWVVQMEAGSGTARRTNGIYFGAGDFGGGNRWVRTVDEYRTLSVFDTSGALLDDDGDYECWMSPNGHRGMAFNGVSFFTIDSQGVLTEYSSWNWPEASTIAWVGLSAFDSDPAGVSSGTSGPHVGQVAGQHETPVGVLSSLNQARRAHLVLTLPVTQDSGEDDDPDQWKVYYARTTVEPTLPSQLALAGQNGNPAVSTSVAITSDPTGVEPPGGIGGQPSALNNFPESTAGAIYSSATDGSGPIIALKGNGSGRVGPLAWDVRSQVLNTPVPPGVILPYGGATAPTGFLLCDGAAVSRTLYSDLFAAIGTYYGTGNGSTTFNLPDSRNRTLVGAGSERALGSNDGLAEGSRTPAHVHNASGLSTGTPTETPQTWNTPNTGSNGTVRTPSFNQHVHNVTGTTGNSGGWTGGNSGLPHQTVNHIIKT